MCWSSWWIQNYGKHNTVLGVGKEAFFRRRRSSFCPHNDEKEYEYSGGIRIIIAENASFRFFGASESVVDT